MKSLIYCFLAFLIIIFSHYRIFSDLNNIPVERWDEQSNINVVNESLDQNTFPALFLDGKPFFEKPPFWYFLTMIIVENSQNEPFNYRIISAISGIILIIIVMLFSKKSFGRVASLTSGFFLLTAGQLYTNNINNTFSTHHIKSADLDILQILLMFIIVLFIYKIETDHKKQNLRKLILIGILTGLAFLTKGIFAVYPVALWLFIKLIKDFKCYKIILKDSIPIIASALIISLPWYLYMFNSFGFEFIQSHFGYHTFERAFIPLEGHEEPWNFHITNLFLPDFFWGGAFVVIFYAMLVKSRLYRDFRYLYLSLYFSIILLVITLIQTKLAWYALYLYPIGAILAGICISQIYQFLNNYFITNHLFTK